MSIIEAKMVRHCRLRLRWTSGQEPEICRRWCGRGPHAELREDISRVRRLRVCLIPPTICVRPSPPILLC